MTVAGIGPIVYPPLIHYLLNEYDVDGCMLIIGGIALNMLVAALLLQPIKWHWADSPAKVETNEAKACDFMSKCSLCSNSAKLPNVMTFQSIGKFSESSCKYASVFFLCYCRLYSIFQYRLYIILKLVYRYF